LAVVTHLSQELSPHPSSHLLALHPGNHRHHHPKKYM